MLLKSLQDGLMSWAYHDLFFLGMEPINDGQEKNDNFFWITEN